MTILQAGMKLGEFGRKSYQPIMPDALYYADAETLLPCRLMSHLFVTS
jgi:hypothetical protein